MFHENDKMQRMLKVRKGRNGLRTYLSSQFGGCALVSTGIEQRPGYWDLSNVAY